MTITGRECPLAASFRLIHRFGMYRRCRLLAFFAVSLGSSLLPAADETAAARRVRAHATFLADDAMEGRAAGTRGYQLAANYVAAQFARLGLEPGAGPDSFRQPVRLVEIVTDREAARFVVRQNGTEDALKPVDEMSTAPAADLPEATITAPAVYVGYGVHAPHLGHDDLAGVDLRGKIAVVLTLAPLSFPGDEYAHYTELAEKYQNLAAHGAAGVVSIAAPRSAARQPWRQAVGNARRPAARVLDAEGRVVDGYPELRVRASVNPAVAPRLFVAAPVTAVEAFAATERNEVRSFPLNVELTLSAKAEVRALECANILGWLPGSDPALADEPLVVTGHLDHLGLATSGEDRVFNGAMDNALGMGVLLAAAEELTAGSPLRRPVLFAALTAEERGLLGAKYLARRPPPRVRRYAANVNIDMPILVAPLTDVVGFGAEHTTLGATLQRAAAKTGFTVTPDWMPEQRVFVRSDQYAFIREGVPSLMLGTGRKGRDGTDLEELRQDFLQNRYHRRNDDLAQAIPWETAGAYAAFAAEMVRDAANDPVAPSWLPGNYFGERFGRAHPKEATRAD